MDEKPAEATATEKDPAADMKRKFREALDRKNKKNLENPLGNVEGESAVHGVRSKAGGQREFRRKSGG